MLSLFGIDKPALMTGNSIIAPLTKNKTNRRVLFLLLDGWGVSDNKKGNLIYKAHTPVIDEIMKNHLWARLAAAGESVGLPKGTVGNSEAGHLHIGAGRIIYSDRLRIDQAITDGSFFQNEAFISVIDNAVNHNRPLHLLGIVSFFSSHGSLEHLLALIDMAKQRGIKELYVHAMLGRRGELPKSGARYIEQVEKKLEEISLGKVVSVIGRYWSMDREENWDRIEKTYQMLVDGAGITVR